MSITDIFASPDALVLIQGLSNEGQAHALTSFGLGTNNEELMQTFFEGVQLINFRKDLIEKYNGYTREPEKIEQDINKNKEELDRKAKNAMYQGKIDDINNSLTYQEARDKINNLTPEEKAEVLDLMGGRFVDAYKEKDRLLDEVHKRLSTEETPEADIIQKILNDRLVTDDLQDDILRPVSKEELENIILTGHSNIISSCRKITIFTVLIKIVSEF